MTQNGQRNIPHPRTPSLAYKLGRVPQKGGQSGFGKGVLASVSTRSALASGITFFLPCPPDWLQQSRILKSVSKKALPKAVKQDREGKEDEEAGPSKGRFFGPSRPPSEPEEETEENHDWIPITEWTAGDMKRFHPTWAETTEPRAWNERVRDYLLRSQAVTKQWGKKHKSLISGGDSYQVWG